MAADAPPVRSFRDALCGGFGIIAEIKARSPSAGEMDRANVGRAAKVYEHAPGVSALSILTQESHFGGSVADLSSLRAQVSKPILRKDFITDEYQVWEARAFGADAILLMASLFSGPDGGRPLRELLLLAHELGMKCLVEIGMGGVRVPEMAAAIPDEADIWGANSRTFHGSRLRVRARIGRLLGRDLTTSGARHRLLRREIPPGRIAVAESGIDRAEQLWDLAGMGYNAALIGTAFLRSGRTVEDVVQSFSGVALEIRARHGRVGTSQ